MHEFNPGSMSQTIMDKNNFKVIGKVYSQYSTAYYFFIHLDEECYLSKARDILSKNALLQGKPRSLVNVVCENVMSGFFPIYYKKTFYLSADVIEFIDTKDSIENRIEEK